MRARTKSGGAPPGLFGRYAVVLVGLVAAAILASGLLQMYLSYQQSRAYVFKITDEQAAAASSEIESFLSNLQQQLAWVIPPPALRDSVSLERRLDDYDRLLRLVPAVTEVDYLDSSGKEQILASRFRLNSIGGGPDLSADPRFLVPRSGRPYFAPVYFRNDSEPYLTLALPESGPNPGVVSVEVNLKFVREVVNRIHVGQRGYAYVVDATGRLIAHPDINLVLKKTDLAGTPQVKAALAARQEGAPSATTLVGADLSDNQVLSASRAIAGPGWYVFVDQPAAEAFSPLYRQAFRTSLLLLVGVVVSALLALLLARRLARPIQILRQGAARLAAGDLGQRIEVAGAAELQGLAIQFNHMAAQLQGAKADLERDLADRTSELTMAVRQARAYEDELREQARYTLTPRERDVVALLVQGFTNRQIAQRLVITEGTAKVHVEHILDKLGLANRGQVAAWAVSQQPATS